MPDTSLVAAAIASPTLKHPPALLSIIDHIKEDLTLELETMNLCFQCLLMQ